MTNLFCKRGTKIPRVISTETRKQQKKPNLIKIYLRCLWQVLDNMDDSTRKDSGPYEAKKPRLRNTSVKDYLRSLSAPNISKGLCINWSFCLHS